MTPEEGRTNFTPGPWKASGNGIHVGTKCIAIACDPETFDRGSKVAQANARLISAAPDYHVAALAMVERHDEKARAANFTTCGCDDCTPFRAIIAKAIGD